MIRNGILALVVMGLGMSAVAQTSSGGQANAGPDSVTISDGTRIQATLVTSLDSKRNKPGDPIAARTTQDVKQNGQVVLKKGTRLTGHVTQAQVRTSGNSQSTLGVVFDSATAKNGQPIPLNLMVRALAAAVATDTSAPFDDRPVIADGDAEGGAAGSAAPTGTRLGRDAGDVVGGVTDAAGNLGGDAGRTANGTIGATTRTTASAGSTGGLNGAGQLMATSNGVFNLQGLNLASAASNGTQVSVVNSNSQNVHLDSGTQMVLQVAN